MQFLYYFAQKKSSRQKSAFTDYARLLKAASRRRQQSVGREHKQTRGTTANAFIETPASLSRASPPWLWFLLFFLSFSPALALKPLKRDDQNVQGRTESLRFGVLICETTQRTNADGSSCSRLHHRQPLTFQGFFKLNFVSSKASTLVSGTTAVFSFRLFWWKHIWLVFSFIWAGTMVEGELSESCALLKGTSEHLSCYQHALITLTRSGTDPEPGPCYRLVSYFTGDILVAMGAEMHF